MVRLQVRHSYQMKLLAIFVSVLISTFLIINTLLNFIPYLKRYALIMRLPLVYLPPLLLAQH